MKSNLKRTLSMLIALLLATPALPALGLAEEPLDISGAASFDATDSRIELELPAEEAKDLFLDGLGDLDALEGLTLDPTLAGEDVETMPPQDVRANDIDPSILYGTWKGTSIGSDRVERNFRLDIDYVKGNSFEGILTINEGAAGSFYFDGTLDLNSGYISFKGSDWIDNPENFGFANYSGTLDVHEKTIVGTSDGAADRILSLRKTSDSYESTRIDLQSVPKDWKGEHDGGYGGDIVVRRNCELHIEEIDSNGNVKGTMSISPNGKTDPAYDVHCSFYVDGHIDSRRGKIALQGTKWIQYPVSADAIDWTFPSFEGFFNASSSSITGKSKQGIWEMKATSPSPEAPKPTGVTITQGKSASMKVGDTLTLKANLTPKGAKTTLTWSSSKPTVATVTSKGKVKALKAGSTNITVKTANGKKATCKVTVTNVKPTSISVSPKKVTMKRDKTLNLAVTFKPKNTTNKAVTWKSSHPLVATVNSKGVVTALRPGKATITAVSKADKKLTATCKVTVSGKFRALLIGQNNYNTNPLKGCVNDANAMKAMLNGLADDYTTCRVQKNRTANEIVSDIQTYLGSAKEDDVSVFYYSGHGANANGGANQGALCGVDGSFLSTARLAKALGKVKGRVIVLIDACNSGALISRNGDSSASVPFNPDAFVQDFMSAFAGRGDVSNAAEFRNSKYVVLVAARFDETSQEEKTGKLWWKNYQGKFTAALIKGMGCDYKKGTYKGSMPADKNSDKGVTVKELYNYIKGQVGKKQTTGYYADNTGEIMFMH